MKKELEIVINLWYKNWLLLNDPYTSLEDPLDIIENALSNKYKLIKVVVGNTEELLIL